MKCILLTGPAPCLFSDVIEFMTDFPKVECDFMAIGLDAISKYQCALKYFVTYHIADIPLAMARRHRINGNIDYKTIAHENKPGVDIVIEHIDPSGSSALLGVRAAIHLKYDKIILCGCPMQGISQADKAPYDRFQLGWTEHKKKGGDFSKVRSMSGWTRDFLGAPTKEWIR